MPTFFSVFRSVRLLGSLAVAILLIAGAVWLLRARVPVPAIPPPSEPAASIKTTAPALVAAPAASTDLAPPPAPATVEIAEQPSSEEVAYHPSFDLTNYDQRIAALVAAIQSRRDAGEAAVRSQIPALLASNDPLDAIAGLALLAGFRAWDLRSDLSGFPLESALAAADLCAALFDPQDARDLLARWAAGAGGPQSAGEQAHDLLLKAELPYGGGSAALDLMQSVNDPQAIFIGQYEFAVEPRLPDAVRTEALVRLRDRMAPDAYLDLVRECVERARQGDESWALRAERLQARLAAAVDRGFVDSELARPYPGLVEDLEIQFRNDLAAGRLAIDPETAAYFRDALAKLDSSALAGPDRAAAPRLRRLLESRLR